MKQTEKIAFGLVLDILCDPVYKWSDAKEFQITQCQLGNSWTNINASCIGTLVVVVVVVVVVGGGEATF